MHSLTRLPTANRIHAYVHSYLDFIGLTQMSLFTLSTTPATEAINFPSSVYVPWPLQGVHFPYTVHCKVFEIISFLRE